MTNYPVRQPVYPGQSAVQTPFKPVTVINVNTETRIALVRDSFGTVMEVRCDIMAAKGNLPAQGEQWIIDRPYGTWKFGAILNGTTNGVEVPQENVHGLPEIVTAYDERMTNIADTALTNVNTVQTNLNTVNSTLTTNLGDLETRSIGRITTKGDLLAGTAAGVVARQPVGANNLALVADSTIATGLAYKDLTGRPANFAGITPLTAPTRWVGSIASTPSASWAPASGTWAVGDFVITGTGHVWVCSVAGTPGTWLSTTQTAYNRLDALAAGLGGGAARTTAPYAQMVFNGSYNYATAQGDLWAQGGWVSNGATDGSMIGYDGTYSYLMAPIAGRYRCYVQFMTTGAAVDGTFACKMGTAVNTSSCFLTGVIRSTTQPGESGLIHGTSEPFLNANQRVYWSNWGNNPYTVVGTQFGGVRTYASIHYIGPS